MLVLRAACRGIPTRASALSLVAARSSPLRVTLAFSAPRAPVQLPTTRAFVTSRDEDDKQKPTTPAADQQLQQQKKPGKIRALIAQYGMPFLIWWTAVWAGTGVGLFVAFDTGIIAGADAIQFVMDMGLDRFVDVKTLNPTYGNMALAAVLNELIEPVRFPFAVATLPMVKRAFAKKTPPADQTKE